MTERPSPHVPEDATSSDQASSQLLKALTEQIMDAHIQFLTKMASDPNRPIFVTKDAAERLEALKKEKAVLFDKSPQVKE